jgi:polygalacturonase
VGDGHTVNTKAIQSAIDDCAARGGGDIIVPPGTFLTGALFFKQGVNLHLLKDGVLKSTTNMADFPPIYTRWEGIERYWTPALLNFIGMNHVTVSGEGLIDGSGEDWPGVRGARGARGGFGGGNFTGNVTAGGRGFARGEGGNASLATTGNASVALLPKVADVYPSPLPSTAVLSFAPDPAHLPTINAAGIALPRMGAPRGGNALTTAADNGNTTAAPAAPAAAPRNGLAPPRTLVFQNCQNVRVANIHVLNEARWGVVFIYTDHVVAENINVRNPEHNIPSSDGMDIDSCRHVLVTGCYFECNDDCLSIKSGKDADGLRVNRPCEDVLIEKTHFAFGHGGAAMGSETSGGIRRIVIRDCLADQGNLAPIRFKSQPSRGGVVEDITYSNITLHDTRQAFEFNLAWDMRISNGAPPAKVLPVVRNIKLINISGTVRSAGVISGLPGSPIENVVFQNCNITAATGLTIDNARGLDLSGLHLTVTEGDAITQTNVQ